MGRWTGSFRTPKGQEYIWTGIPDCFIKIYQSYIDEKGLKKYEDFINDFLGEPCKINKFTNNQDIDKPCAESDDNGTVWPITDPKHMKYNDKSKTSYGDGYEITIGTHPYRINTNLGEPEIVDLEAIAIEKGYYDLNRYYNGDTENCASKLTNKGKSQKGKSNSETEQFSTSPARLAGNRVADYIDNAFFKNNKQIVLTGAPGTGKTYTVKQYVKDKTKETEPRNHWTFVQFHPSYDYSDFVEGLRPVPDPAGSGNIFVRLDGSFKAFCRKIVSDELEQIKIKFPGKTDREAFDIYKTIHGEMNAEPENRDSDLNENNRQRNIGQYYFIIDEINRADLSKVFGEIMYCLDEDYRGPHNGIQTQYAALKTYHKDDATGKYTELNFDCFEEGFFIPDNLHIIGTMNDIDRSVESFDFALRRRFLWKEIDANGSLEELGSLVKMPLSGTELDLDELIARAIKVNNLLDPSQKQDYKRLGLNKQYQLGKAYYKSFDGSKSSLEDIYNGKIEPIIREYTRGRDQELVQDLLKKIYEILFETNVKSDDLEHDSNEPDDHSPTETADNSEAVTNQDGDAANE